MLCDDLEGWEGVNGRELREGGDVCLHIADPHGWTAETNNGAKQLYSSFKKQAWN